MANLFLYLIPSWLEKKVRAVANLKLAIKIFIACSNMEK